MAFSGGSTRERQWEGLCARLNNLLIKFTVLFIFFIYLLCYLYILFIYFNLI